MTNDFAFSMPVSCCVSIFLELLQFHSSDPESLNPRRRGTRKKRDQLFQCPAADTNCNQPLAGESHGKEVKPFCIIFQSSMYSHLKGAWGWVLVFIGALLFSVPDVAWGAI